MVEAPSSPSLSTVEEPSSSPTLPPVEALGDSRAKGVVAAPCWAAKRNQAARVVASVVLEVEQLMADYPSVVNSSKKLPEAKYQVGHMIETTCSHPVKAHYCPLDKDKLAAGGWHMGAMLGLQAAQFGHQARPIPATTN